MRQLLIASALGFLFLSSCGSNNLDNTVATPIERPALVLPTITPLQLRDITWKVITPTNADSKVYFALTVEEYEQLALNMSDLRAYIAILLSHITAYKDYYVK